MTGQKRTIGFITLNRVGKTDAKQKEPLLSYCTANGLAAELVEGRYSKKKPWRKREELARILSLLDGGGIFVVPSLDLLGSDNGDILSFIAELIKRKADIHIVDIGLTVKGSGYAAELVALFTLMAALTTAPKGKPGRKPGRPPAKKKRGRPAKKKKPGRPPKKKIGRPAKKKKPGRKPSPRKRISALQDQFNDQVLTIRKFLVNRFSVKTIAEMLEMPYQPLLALIRKHPTLSTFVKRGR